MSFLYGRREWMNGWICLQLRSTKVGFIGVGYWLGATNPFIQLSLPFTQLTKKNESTLINQRERIELVWIKGWMSWCCVWVEWGRKDITIYAVIWKDLSFQWRQQSTNQLNTAHSTKWKNSFVFLALLIVDCKK